MARKARLSKQTSATMRLRAPVTITAAAEGTGGEKQGPPTFQSVAYSGGLVPGYTANPALPHPYVIDLAGNTSHKSPKANLDHKNNQRVGHATSVLNDGKQIEVSGVLSAATSHRDEVANSARDGFEWEVSIEADLYGKKAIPAGKSAVVNGRTIEGPAFVFSKSQLTGLAFVSQGADEGNHVTIAATAGGAKEMNEFEKYIVSCGADPETITDEQRANLKRGFDASQQSSDGEETLSFAAAATKVRKENERKDTIQKMALSAMSEHPLYHEQIQTLATAALSGDTTPKDFELELLRGTRVQAGRFSNFNSASQPHTNPEMIECALSMASGLPNLEKYYSEQTLNAVDRAGMRSIGLQQVLMQTAIGNGMQARAGERITINNIRTVLEYCFPPAHARLGGGFSVAALPNILGSVANKQILAGYMEEDQSWKEIAEIKPANNFYTQNHYRMLDNLEYEEVGPGGEIKQGTLGEEGYTSQLKTYGKMLGLNMQQIINDDLGAFLDIRNRLGRGGAKKFGNVLWAAFMDNSAFFTSGLTNYISGSTTNLGTDGVGLGLGVTAFRQMTTPSADGSKRIGAGLNPNKLILPPELEANGDILHKNTNLGAVASSSANIYGGKYRPVVQWRLSNSSYTGYSTTAWYMFGDELKPMLVTFLNGNQTPVVESADADFDTLGIRFRGYHHWSASKSEYLAGIKSKGAA